MKFILYNIVLHLLLTLLSPYFLFRLLTQKKCRNGIGEKFGFVSSKKLSNLTGSQVVWVHAVSVGETKAAIPLLRELKSRQPNIKILFSTITKTGNDVAGIDGKGLIDALIYFPLDLPSIAGRVIRKTKPDLFILIEKEFWPNTMRGLHSSSVPIVVVNGSISEKSARRYRSLGFFFKDIFSTIDTFCARTEEDRKRALSIGVAQKSALTVGNIKFDLRPPAPDSAQLKSITKSASIRRGTCVIVAGSTHRGEEEIILDAFKKVRIEDVRLIIAPRHPERFKEVESIIRNTGLAYVRRSAEPTNITNIKRVDVLLLDTIGELMPVYSISNVAIVGGSFVQGIGGHNLLEPAYFNKPVLYGPYLTTYKSMAELLGKEGGAVQVDSPEEIADTLNELLSNDLLRTKRGLAAGRVVKENRGALDKSVLIIERLISRKNSSNFSRV